MSIVAQTLTRAARVATLTRWQRTAVADMSATRSLPRTLTQGKLKGVGSQVAARLPGAVAFGVGALALRLASRFRRDIDGAYRRLEALESTVTITAAGPTEYMTFGAGPPVLVIHGNGGGFDQGVESAQPTLGETFRAIVPSRFGYLRAPLPADASPAQQADAYASLLNHLGVARVAVIAYSAG